MADLIIPGWAVFLMGGIGSLILFWLVWLTKKTSENDKAIAINTAHDTSVGDELKKLDKKIDELKKDIYAWADKIEHKVDSGFQNIYALLSHRN